MARKHVLRQSKFLAINAMPSKGTTFEEIYEATGLDEGRQPPVGSPVRVRFDYCGDRIFLNPGDSIELRESEAESFKAAVRDQGCIVVPDDATELETMEATLDVWRARQSYYREKGKTYAREMMIASERPVDQLETVYKYSYYPYIVNERLADILTENIVKLVKAIKKLKKDLAKEEAAVAAEEAAA